MYYAQIMSFLHKHHSSAGKQAKKQQIKNQAPAVLINGFCVHFCLNDLCFEEMPSQINAVSLQADKRAHHNALERKRRDHIKDSFHGLRDSVPALYGEKVREDING